jgi:hypothetical protein
MVPEDLHTKEGAEKFAQGIFELTRKNFLERGGIPPVAFLLAVQNPATNQAFETPRVLAVEYEDLCPENYLSRVQQYARDTRAVGVMVLMPGTGGIETSDLSGTELDELLTGKTPPEEQMRELVLVIFEHLRFDPMLRFWSADVFRSTGHPELGEFVEGDGPLESLRGSPSSFLDFYN